MQELILRDYKGSFTVKDFPKFLNRLVDIIDLFQKSSQKHFSSRLSQADEPRRSDFSAEKYATARKVVSRKTFERTLIIKKF